MSTLARPDIPAAKNWLGDELIYRLLARRSLQRSFHRVWVQTHGPLPAPHDGPIILYLNHSGWWDGYMMYMIHRVVLRARFDAYLVMEERQLRAYRFFTWSGAFGLNRFSADGVRRAQAYAAGLLADRRRSRALFIFPQGKIVPNDRRPLDLYPGIARIAALTGPPLTLVPVAMRYEFLGQQHPHAFIRIGPGHRPDDLSDQRAVLAAIKTRLTAACDALRDDVVSGSLEGYVPILHGQAGIDQRFDRLRALIKRG
ncbi:MAG: lysophospholipid acyltransferase family protein [Oscillochloridaceae bacterium umkhey_bin13]